MSIAMSIEIFQTTTRRLRRQTPPSGPATVDAAMPSLLRRLSRCLLSSALLGIQCFLLASLPVLLAARFVLDLVIKDTNLVDLTTDSDSDEIEDIHPVEIEDDHPVIEDIEDNHPVEIEDNHPVEIEDDHPVIEDIEDNHPVEVEDNHPVEIEDDHPVGV